MRIPLITDTDSRDGSSNKDERLTNVLVEIDAEKMACLRPGLNGLATSSGNGNNLVCFGGELVNIYGNTVYRMDAEGGGSYNDPQTIGLKRYFFWESVGAHVDSLVITKGEARYDSNYSPSCPLGASDPLWDNVVLYIDFEGADGSTTITDAKGHSITNSGLEIDTAQYACGSSSLLLDGTGQISLSAYSSDFDFGTGDFCIETKVRFYDINDYDWGAVDFNFVIFSTLSGPIEGYDFGIGSSIGDSSSVDTIFFTYGGAIIATGFIDPLANGTWYSFAVSRKDGIVRLFFDGEVITEIDTAVYTQTNIGTVTDNFFDFALIP